MVVIPPPCTPRVLDAYPNVPISPSVGTSIIHDFNVGSFARFQHPTSVISIHDRPDLHSLSHFEIRQRLDAEGQHSDIIIIDSDTAANHAVWYVLSTEESAFWTEEEHGAGFPPKEYPGEIPLWKEHILTQHLPINYELLISGKPIWEDLSLPYDPHDPQIPPLSMGVDYSKKEDAMSNAWFSRVPITASPGEYDFSDDPKTRQQTRFVPIPLYVVRLTPEAARGAGLLSEWEAWWKPLPGAGASIQFGVHYDWDSPKWAWDGMIRRNETASGRSIKNNGILRMGCRAQTMNLNGADHRLPLMRNGRMLNQSVPATA
ncbi:MAG: hypothetical protein Q9181_001538 [Wetmoreana brouardii]